MNIISVENDIIKEKTYKDVLIKYNKKHINIDIINDINLCIDIKDCINPNIKIDIKKNINSKIFLMSSIKNTSLTLLINIDENSKLLFNHFSINNDVSENKKINLNGENAKIEYYYSCRGKTNQVLEVYHNCSKTNSIVSSHGISNGEKQEFIIKEKVPKNIINCNLNQKSKIININDNISTIKPILLIDEKEVMASHSSVISPINDNELFYLMSRGITKDESINLLTNGFLINNLKLENEEKHLLFEKYIFRR